MKTPAHRHLSTLGLACLLTAAGISAGAADPTFIDDQALAESFVTDLAKLVDRRDLSAGTAAISSREASSQLMQAEGRHVRLPPSPTLCILKPEQSLYEAVVPAVVVVGSIYKCNSCSDWHLGGMASGWLLADNGLVVTNHHVFGEEGDHRFGVMTADGEVFAVTTILAADRAGDAAIAQIDTRGRKLPAVAVGPRPACGEAVTVISHPAGRFYSLTKGIVSRYHRQPDEPAPATNRSPAAGKEGETAAAPIWMSVTADFAVGSSGGPVFNADGEVVGMVSRTFSSEATRNHRRRSQFGTQMVFKDCVSRDTLGKLIDPAG
jgi:S1-C subfamily serine protease